MKRSIVTLATLLLGIAFAAMALAAPNDNDQPAAGPSVAGTWTCVAHGVGQGGQGGDTPFTLTLEQQGETVTGSVAAPMGDADITKASFKDGTLEIEVASEDAPYTLSGTLDQGKLKGRWTHGQANGAWEGSKATDSSKPSSDSQ